MNQAAVNKPERDVVLDSVVVRNSRRVYFASLLDVLEIKPSPNDPLTVSVAEAARLSGFSPRTIHRMLARGRDAE
jgi:hypothetical protein